MLAQRKLDNGSYRIFYYPYMYTYMRIFIDILNKYTLLYKKSVFIIGQEKLAIHSPKYTCYSYAIPQLGRRAIKVQVLNAADRN